MPWLLDCVGVFRLVVVVSDGVIVETDDDIVLRVGEVSLETLIDAVVYADMEEELVSNAIEEDSVDRISDEVTIVGVVSDIEFVCELDEVSSKEVIEIEATDDSSKAVVAVIEVVSNVACIVSPTGVFEVIHVDIIAVYVVSCEVVVEIESDCGSDEVSSENVIKVVTGDGSKLVSNLELSDIVMVDVNSGVVSIIEVVSKVVGRFMSVGVFEVIHSDKVVVSAVSDIDSDCVINEVSSEKGITVVTNDASKVVSVEDAPNSGVVSIIDVVSKVVCIVMSVGVIEVRLM